MSEASDVPAPAAGTGGGEATAVGVAATGHAPADAAAARLRDLDAAPLEEHVEIYDDVHRQLQETLADVDHD